MSRIESRLSRLEAKTHPERRQVPFLWCSDADNPAMEAAEARAQAEGKEFFLIKLVAPEIDERGKAVWQ